MENWLLITIMIIGLITFLALVIWLDWSYKCRKSVRDNSLRIFLPGYIALRKEYVIACSLSIWFAEGSNGKIYTL